MVKFCLSGGAPSLKWSLKPLIHLIQTALTWFVFLNKSAFEKPKQAHIYALLCGFAQRKLGTGPSHYTALCVKSFFFLFFQLRLRFKGLDFYWYACRAHNQYHFSTLALSVMVPAVTWSSAAGRIPSLHACGRLQYVLYVHVWAQRACLSAFTEWAQMGHLLVCCCWASTQFVEVTCCIILQYGARLGLLTDAAWLLRLSEDIL